jgi:glycosyltransferase involved in cell wall biosynthesis
MALSSLVSVIIPFLNAEKFFEEAIESVFNQTYSTWELLLIDDGSSDGSTQIALDYASKYPDKVRYLTHDGHTNKGSSASRNLGIRSSRGKYIATLDADDIWLPNKLQEQVYLMESYPVIGMVYGDTKAWYSWTGNIEDKVLEYYGHNRILHNSLRLNSVIHPPALLTLNLHGYVLGASMSNAMFRKKVIDEIGGFEEVFTGMHDDQAFRAKLYLNSPVYVSESCWDFYRQHPESCYHTAVEKGQWLNAELFYLAWLEKYFAKNGIKDPELLKALHKRIFQFKHPTSYKLFLYGRQFLRRVKKKVGL